MNELTEIIIPMLNSKYAARGVKPTDRLNIIFKDELSPIELLANIEFDLGIYISETEFKQMKTVADLYNRIYSTCASQ